jgi:hypothetical protein
MSTWSTWDQGIAGTIRTPPQHRVSHFQVQTMDQRLLTERAADYCMLAQKVYQESAKFRTKAQRGLIAPPPALHAQPRSVRAPHRLRPPFRIQVEDAERAGHGERTSTAAKQVQGGSARKGELETQNHSVSLIKRIFSPPFLAEPPYTVRAATRRVRGEMAQTSVSSDMKDVRGQQSQCATLWAGVEGEGAVVRWLYAAGRRRGRCVLNTREEMRGLRPQVFTSRVGSGGEGVVVR